MTHQPFAAWLRHHLERLNMTPGQLVKQLDGTATKGQVSEWLSGKHSATKCKARIVAKVLEAELPVLYQPYHRWHPKPRDTTPQRDRTTSHYSKSQ